MDAANRPVQGEAPPGQQPLASAAVQEHLRRLNMALAAGGMGTWEWTPATNLVHCDPRHLQLWDLDPAVPDVPAERIFERIVPEDRDRLWTDNARVVAGGHQETEFRIRRSDGQIRWLAVYADVVQDVHGNAVRVVGVNYDITERKAQQQALQEREAMLQKAISAPTVGVLFFGLSGRIHSANEAFQRMCGYSVAELAAIPHWRVLTAPESWEPTERTATALAERGIAPPYEKQMVRKDGTTWWGLFAPTRLSGSGWDIECIEFIIDITDRKRAEAELAAAHRATEEAKQAAESASRAKDQFLAVLSHELRNPLTPVLTTATMLQRDSTLGEEVREHLEVIRRNAELEARLIDDLLDVTRIARGKVELIKERAELCTVISRAVEVCRPDFEARGIHFGIDWGARPYWVDADVSRLQQVFWNLLKNAAKFTPHGGCVGVRCRWVDSLVEVEVIDSGIGIAPDALSRIFNPFEQAERTITRQFGGLGLGLAICKAMVDMHGGTIAVHSEGKGRGAVFRVRLPTAAPAGPPGPAPRPDAGHPRPAEAERYSLRILLVEDHGDTARIMRRMLTMEGHSVAVAGDVATALDLAREEEFDLLLSDMGLPDASGIDLLWQLRKLGRGFPAVALSGYGQEQDLQRSREAGFAAHLVKPVSIDQLLRTIANVVVR